MAAIDMIFHPISALFLFPVMLVLVVAGRRYRTAQGKAVVSSAIEGAVFALFGLTRLPASYLDVLVWCKAMPASGADRSTNDDRWRVRRE